MPFTQLTDDLWVLNRPARLGPIDLGHRMTVVRLASGRLWVHSPVALADEIRTELDALGEVENFVAPSTFHDLYWPAWFAAYPEARFGVSRLYKMKIKDERAMRRSVDEVLAWDFNRIVLGHGRVVEKGGQQILKDAYDFLRS